MRKGTRTKRYSDSLPIETRLEMLDDGRKKLSRMILNDREVFLPILKRINDEYEKLSDQKKLLDLARNLAG